MSEPCTNLKKSGGRWHPDSSGKGKMVIGDVEENIAKREVYWRCPPVKNLYSGFSF